MKTTNNRSRSVQRVATVITVIAAVLTLTVEVDSGGSTIGVRTVVSAANANPFQKIYDNTVKKVGRATGLNNVVREVKKGVQNTGRGIRNIPNDLRRPGRIPGNIVR